MSRRRRRGCRSGYARLGGRCASAGRTAVAGDGRIGLLQTGLVEATGDVNGLVLITGSVKAGGDVNVTFDAVSAGILGAAIAVVLFLLRRMFGR